MNYSLSSTLRENTGPFEKKISNGFRAFIRMLLGSQRVLEEKETNRLDEHRNQFLYKYQQLLNKGKSANVEVVNVKALNNNKTGRNTVVQLSYQLLKDKSKKIYKASALATKENIPARNSIIPVFYNPQDTSILVLL